MSFRRRRLRGQALVETALVAPFLVMLLLGGAQVGQIAYDEVSVDTAAREGAAAGAAQPNQSLTPWYVVGGPTTQSHLCTTADFTSSPANPICQAVYDSGGYLDQTLFTSGKASVTVSVKPQDQLTAVREPEPRVRLVGTGNNGNCSSTQTLVTVNVDFVASGSTNPLSDLYTNGKGPAVSSTNPTVTWCVDASKSNGSDIITAQQGPNCGPGGYSGTTGSFPILAGQPTTAPTITLQAEPACPTPTPGPTPTPTPTPMPTPTPTPMPTPTPGPTPRCGATTVPSTYVFTVVVTYPQPIFVPFINALFETAPGTRTITASVTNAILPQCITNPA